MLLAKVMDNTEPSIISITSCVQTSKYVDINDKGVTTIEPWIGIQVVEQVASAIEMGNINQESEKVLFLLKIQSELYGNIESYNGNGYSATINGC